MSTTATIFLAFYFLFEQAVQLLLGDELSTHIRPAVAATGYPVVIGVTGIVLKFAG